MIGRMRVPALAPVAVAAALAASPAADPPPGESPAAREQARLCERLAGEPALEACRQALALGIGPARRAGIRTLLSRQLVALERWDELAAFLRESVRLDPSDAVVWHRLGATLLFALEQPAEAVAALDQAVHLAPQEAHPSLDLGLALAAAGRSSEAVAAIEAAVRLDAEVLESRPAARAVLEAARKGKSWP
jgi:Flp pilus assembly protein TadD